MENNPVRRQRGSMSIMFASLLLVVLGFMGLVVDLGRIQNRQAELQGTLDGAALAAARQLNNTVAGVNLAVAAAAAATAGNRNYQAGAAWPAENVRTALRFSNQAGMDAVWRTADEAAAAPAGMLFVQFDSSLITPPDAAVTPIFMGLFSNAAAVTASGRAIAGSSSIRVAPLALCALDQALPQPTFRDNDGTVNNQELVEYGFRRGVGYNLLNLNPIGAAPLNFIVNPIDGPGEVGDAANLAPAVVAPFVCSGTMLRPRVVGAGAEIAVAAPFPIGALFGQLNSRFGGAAGPCDRPGAPRDNNVTRYDGSGGSGGSANYWPAATGQNVAVRVSGNRKTAADLPRPVPAPGPVPAADYGRLWSFARPVRWSTYQATPDEPASGYLPFPTTAVATLYPAASGSLLSATYQTANPKWTPYLLVPAQPDTEPRLARRRVLNVPLLACPVPASGLATVRAIGRFFMTVPATATVLSAEFAGLVPESSVRGPVELYR